LNTQSRIGYGLSPGILRTKCFLSLPLNTNYFYAHTRALYVAIHNQNAVFLEIFDVVTADYFTFAKKNVERMQEEGRKNLIS